MREILKNILFRITFSIVALHTFIPHPHSDELSQNEHIRLHNNSKSLFGYIKILFHESEDESLDNLTSAWYLKSKKLLKYIYKKHHSPPLINLPTTDYFCYYEIIFSDVIFLSKRNFQIKQNGLRAPPAA